MFATYLNNNNVCPIKVAPVYREIKRVVLPAQHPNETGKHEAEKAWSLEYKHRKNPSHMHVVLPTQHVDHDDDDDDDIHTNGPNLMSDRHLWLPKKVSATRQTR